MTSILHRKPPTQWCYVEYIIASSEGKAQSEMYHELAMGLISEE